MQLDFWENPGLSAHADHFLWLLVLCFVTMTNMGDEEIRLMLFHRFGDFGSSKIEASMMVYIYKPNIQELDTEGPIQRYH